MSSLTEQNSVRRSQHSSTQHIYWPDTRCRFACCPVPGGLPFRKHVDITGLFVCSPQEHSLSTPKVVVNKLFQKIAVESSISFEFLTLNRFLVISSVLEIRGEGQHVYHFGRHRPLPDKQVLLLKNVFLALCLFKCRISE